MRERAPGKARTLEAGSDTMHVTSISLDTEGYPTREHYPLTDPHPSMVLQEGDTLWVLGTQKMAAILLKADLL